jgi:peroxiredoxin
MHDPTVLPPELPVPIDDGAAAHLTGATIPDIALESTRGDAPSLRELCAKPTVLFFYPRTGVPGQPPRRGFHDEQWEEIPGARGCTPQSCGFRDRHDELLSLGIQIFGVSTQSRDYQLELKHRNGIRFDYLSDAQLTLSSSMNLPTFEFPIESGGPNRLIKRMAWFVDGNTIAMVWYPVFPPNENAAQVITWLRQSREAQRR